MKKKIFIDGKAVTTGLRIEERLSGRDDVEIISLPDELRKDPEAKKAVLNSVDVAFLVAYNSAPGTVANPIIKVEIASPAGSPFAQPVEVVNGEDNPVLTQAVSG